MEARIGVECHCIALLVARRAGLRGFPQAADLHCRSKAAPPAWGSFFFHAVAAGCVACGVSASTPAVEAIGPPATVPVPELAMLAHFAGHASRKRVIPHGVLLEDSGPFNLGSGWYRCTTYSTRQCPLRLPARRQQNNGSSNVRVLRRSQGALLASQQRGPRRSSRRGGIARVHAVALAGGARCREASRRRRDSRSSLAEARRPPRAVAVRHPQPRRVKSRPSGRSIARGRPTGSLDASESDEALERGRMGPLRTTRLWT